MNALMLEMAEQLPLEVNYRTQYPHIRLYTSYAFRNTYQHARCSPAKMHAKFDT